MVLGVVSDLANVVGLPDVVFNFNIGDQPFTDKVYWTAVPQIHWVVAKGHWTIPFPTPRHLRALEQDQLGDNARLDRHHVQWDRRVAKIFWRGTYSIPDHTPFSLLSATPRMRLMRLGSERPDLFDIGVIGFDSVMESFFFSVETNRI